MSALGAVRCSGMLRGRLCLRTFALMKVIQRSLDDVETVRRSDYETAQRLLEEYKPGRRLQTNVEFYTALLLHGLGLDVALFTPTFAISRVSGWIAHALEQKRANRIIRPQSEYTGLRNRIWVPLESR